MSSYTVHTTFADTKTRKKQTRKSHDIIPTVAMSEKPYKRALGVIELLDTTQEWNG